jgi:hypothetical protein
VQQPAPRFAAASGRAGWASGRGDSLGLRGTGRGRKVHPGWVGRTLAPGWKWNRAPRRGDTGVDAGPVWLADLVRVAVALGSAGARQGVRSESRVWRGP